MNRTQAATYLPPYLNKIQKHYSFGSGSNSKLIEVIANLLPLAIKQTAQLAPHFKGGNPQDTARNIFNFLRTQLQYTAEPWHSQNPKAPSALIGSGIGDCKSFALFAYGIAYNLGMNPFLRFTSDVSTSEATHVYTKTTGGVIDGTISQFDYEMPNPKFLKDIKKKIQIWK